MAFVKATHAVRYVFKADDKKKREWQQNLVLYSSCERANRYSKLWAAMQNFGFMLVQLILTNSSKCLSASWKFYLRFTRFVSEKELSNFHDDLVIHVYFRISILFGLSIKRCGFCVELLVVKIRSRTELLVETFLWNKDRWINTQYTFFCFVDASLGIWRACSNPSLCPSRCI
jgi:hypothetical protein